MKMRCRQQTYKAATYFANNQATNSTCLELQVFCAEVLQMRDMKHVLQDSMAIIPSRAVMQVNSPHSTPVDAMDLVRSIRRAVQAHPVSDTCDMRRT
jgi:hypothetical protein